MTNSSDTPEQNYIAAARGKLNTETPARERNPFKAGMARARAASEASQQKHAAQQQESKAELKAIWSEVKESAHGSKDVRNGGIFLALIVVAWLYVHFKPAPLPPPPMTQEQMADASRGMAIVSCNFEAKNHVKNPSSYKRINHVATRQGDEWEVFQNFTAINAFGAALDNYFICKYDFRKNRVTDYQFFEGNY
jgi:hypothetical protein